MAQDAQSRNSKAICFVTGIPGAGKTLAGLDAVHSFAEGQATFLSGNGPLVKVLRTSLAENLVADQKIKKEEANRRASTFITNVHKWLDEYIDNNPDQIPQENVVVFDEAQRAWNREHSFTKFRRDASEADMILRVMDRRKDWALIVALVGGGQEINTGEAGLSEWGRSLSDRSMNWKIGISPELLEGDSSTAGSQLFNKIPERLSSEMLIDEDLHLSVGQRSFRTTFLTDWIEAVLNGNSVDANRLFESIGDFPVLLTRNLKLAKEWLRNNTKGFRRNGLIASSGARRLRKYGINVREQIDETHWFLKPEEDVRSSNFLEITATEFAIQGLELDWVGLCWGGDLRRLSDGWNYMSFKGTKWQFVRSDQEKKFVLNRYRVLLTRAREGIVIWIPEGDPDDPTSGPELYDGTFSYLRSCGIPVLS